MLTGCSNEGEPAVKEKSESKEVATVHQTEDTTLDQPLQEDPKKLEQWIKEGKPVFRLEHGEQIEQQMEDLIESTKMLPKGTKMNYPASEHLRLYQQDLREDLPEYEAYFASLQRAEDFLIDNRFKEAKEEIQKAKKLRTK